MNSVDKNKKICRADSAIAYYHYFCGNETGYVFYAGEFTYHYKTGSYHGYRSIGCLIPDADRQP